MHLMSHSLRYNCCCDPFEVYVCMTLTTAGSKKYEHLLKLEKTSKNLMIFKADILNYESVYKAIVGCSAFFHIATHVPSTVVPNPEVTCFLFFSCFQCNVSLILFILFLGSCNVYNWHCKFYVLNLITELEMIWYFRWKWLIMYLKLVSKLKWCVVFVSSEASVEINPNFPKDKVIDESYWFDKDYCKKKIKVAKILLLVCMTLTYHWP
jgi:hypothetical protein